MSHDNKVILMEHKKKQLSHKLTDHEKVVFAYHYFEQNNVGEAIKAIQDVSQGYWTGQFHKDISRALLCHATYQTTQNPALGKESEFYVVVYRLVKYITSNKIHFNGSGHFYQLKDELYKDFM